MKSILNEMRLNICNVINSYDIPIDIKYYIVKDVFNEITSVYNNFLMTEETEEEKTNIEQDIENQNHTMEITANVEGLTDFLDKEKLLKEMEKEGTNQKTFKVDLKEKEKSNKDQTK